MHQKTRSPSEYRRLSLIGPGGRKCPCCAPAPGKARKLFRRLDTNRWRLLTLMEEERLFDQDHDL